MKSDPANCTAPSRDPEPTHQFNEATSLVLHGISPDSRCGFAGKVYFTGAVDVWKINAMRAILICGCAVISLIGKDSIDAFIALNLGLLQDFGVCNFFRGYRVFAGPECQ